MSGLAGLGGLAGGSGGLLSIVTPAGAALGTGILPIINNMGSIFGAATLPPSIIKSVVSELPGIFGNYVDHSDIAPSAVFVAVFSVLALAHFYIFFKDFSRGHRFYLGFGMAFYCVFRVIGFGLRINWAHDVLSLKVGIASVVFCVVSVLYVSILNMVLGHRIFTWRHPETGNAKWFNFIMNSIYVIVLGVIVMAIVAQVVPFLYFLSEKNYTRCKQVVRVAAVFNVLYSLSGLFLIIIAFIVPPGMIDHRLFKFNAHKEDLPQTFSATWIEKFTPFYFPEKGAQRIVYKDEPLANAIRVIPSRDHPAGGLSERQNPDHHGGPNMKVGIALIAISSIILALNSSFRAASTFVDQPTGDPLSNFIFSNWLLYMLYGAFEAVLSVLYLVLRYDLRFYIPDMAKKRTAGSPVYDPEVQKAESSHLSAAASEPTVGDSDR